MSFAFRPSSVNSEPIYPASFQPRTRFRLGSTSAPRTVPAPGRRIRGPRIATKNRVTQTFRMAAQSLHNSQSYLGDYYRSQRARHGAPKAIKNTAHKLNRIFYHL